MLANKINPAKLLLGFNLKWHAEVLKELLLRYKLFIVFSLLLIAPGFSSLVFFITLPTKALFVSDANLIFFTLSLLAYQLIGLLWLMLQHAVFSNQPWDQYLASLPITIVQKSFSQTILLFVSNILIWVPLILAGVLALEKSFYNDLLNLLKMVTALNIN